MNFLNATINHLCNKLCPYIIIFLLLGATLGWTDWKNFTILGLVIFIDRYNFKSGYYVSLVENNLNLKNMKYEKESKVEE
tara:strand:+ start:2076 stop:2315 length:240 start_codon:yes stop_codon:yes gene_type:complete